MELEGLGTKANPKDAYLKNFDEITPKVESFISLSKVIGDAKPAPKETEEEITFEIEASDEKLDSLTTDVKETKSKDELLEYKKKVEDLKSHLKYLEAEIERRLSEVE